MTLAQARRFALSLAETSEEPHHHLSSFRVAGKIFATVPPEGTHLRIFVEDAARERALAARPGAFAKLWWGQKVMGLEVTLADAPAAMVKDLLLEAWRAKAPKRLLRDTT